MPTYIAMLRGINVSGHRPVKMEHLRVSFEALGFREVRTYVQSGNVVFEANNGSATSLMYCPDGYGRTKLSNTAIEKKLGLEATTRNWKTVRALLALAG